MEPYKIKVFYPLTTNTKSERKTFLKRANYNIFNLKSEEILVDLLTDSGTGSQSTSQWSTMIDAGYSSTNSVYVEKFKRTMRGITNFKHVLPVHQGRGAEELVAKLLLDKSSVVISNTLFDTTRAHVESVGALGIDLAVTKSKFMGDVDIKKFKEALEQYGSSVHLVIVTCTNNAAAGAPVGMENIEEITQMCRGRNIPVIIDACRFAENAYFIKCLDQKYANHKILDISREMFSHFDGATMSLKKDGLSNEGGFIAVNNDAWANKLYDEIEYKGGYTTFGGITGPNLAACTVGILETLDENYLQARVHQTMILAKRLLENNISIVEPVGAHAVYIKANEVLPHISFTKYPAWALTCAVYIEGGIRCGEIGNIMFGETPDGKKRIHPFEYVRLAIPRRTYTVNHMYYVAKMFGEVSKKAHLVHGMQIVKSSRLLRHFTISMKPEDGVMIDEEDVEN